MLTAALMMGCGDKEEDSASEDTAVAEDTAAEWIKLKRGDSTQGSTDNIRPGKE